MIAAGDILEVEVHQVAVFGLFCRAGEQELLVLIPDVSWIGSFASCEQFAAPGDRFRVQVLNVDAQRGRVAASIKALHPDPWVSGELAVGKVHQARVVRWIEHADRCEGRGGNLLELLPGAFVVLCGEPSLGSGATCSVRITAVDPARHAVRVELVAGAMSFEEARERLGFHCGADPRIEDRRWTNGLLSTLRPYAGLRKDVLQDVDRCLVAVAEHLCRAPLLDRRVINSLWGIAEFGRRWGLDENGAIQRDRLMSPEDTEYFRAWLREFSFRVAMLLDGNERNGSW